MKKVNVFVVGAMKAGTTSFVDVLSLHKDIYMPPVKEPHFFVHGLPKFLYDPSTFFDLETYLSKKFPEPLHITQIKNKAQYKKVFSLHNGERYMCDCSTAYLHAPEAPQLIKDYNSEAKIIIITRDPLKRAFSHYRMNLGLGREKRSFESAIKQDIQDFENDNLDSYSYLGMSLYQDAIDRYKKLFENVLVIDFLDYKSSTTSIMHKVAEFLSIENFRETTVAQKNQTKTLRFQKLFFFLKKIGLKDYFSKVFGSSFKQTIFKYVTKSENEKLILSETTLQALETIITKKI